jgi:hypothetical protein
MPYDPDLAERMRSALKTRPGITEKKMFGSCCWLLNGNLLCGVEVGRYLFRVGPEREAEALGRGATPMDITGRPMRGMVWVRADLAEGRDLQRWIDLAAEFAGGLPGK